MKSFVGTSDLLHSERSIILQLLFPQNRIVDASPRDPREKTQILHLRERHEHTDPTTRLELIYVYEPDVGVHVA
ncbi:MAG: hypothetical protein ACE5KH_00270 [Candidatus Geothermarchaeales archaeon]